MFLKRLIKKKQDKKEREREKNNGNERCISGYALLMVGDYISYFLFRGRGGRGGGRACDQDKYHVVTKGSLSVAKRDTLTGNGSVSTPGSYQGLVTSGQGLKPVEWGRFMVLACGTGSSDNVELCI